MSNALWLFSDIDAFKLRLFLVVEILKLLFLCLAALDTEINCY